MVIKTNEGKPQKSLGSVSILCSSLRNFRPFYTRNCLQDKKCLSKSYAKGQWPSIGKNFASAFEKIEVGAKFSPMENLFKKIEDDYVLELEKQFGGHDD